MRNTDRTSVNHTTGQATRRPTIDQIMWMTPDQKQHIPAWHVLNLTIQESWSERDYGAAIVAVVAWPIFWIVSYSMKRYFTKQARDALQEAP